MKIECTLPNASDLISGVKFVRTEHGTMVSAVDVEPPLARRLLSITGYREYSEGESPPKTEVPTAQPKGKK